MKRRIPSLLCALALCAALTPAAHAANFSDVKTGAWYYDAVTTCIDLGLMQGTSSTAFSPGGPVTRAAVVTTLWRLEDSPAAQAAPFPDAVADSWYADALIWGRETGIATGYSDGTFAPNDQVTREQLALFLYRYAVHRGDTVAVGVLDRYRDGDQVSKWAADGMKHALGAGLITGDTDNQLNPKGTATRSELAVILVRLTTPVAG